MGVEHVYPALIRTRTVPHGAGPLEVHLDLGRAEVVVLSQMDDLPDDVGAGRVRVGPVRQRLQHHLPV